MLTALLGTLVAAVVGFLTATCPPAGLSGLTTCSECSAGLFYLATAYASLRVFMRPSCLSSLSINLRISSLSF